MLFQKINNGFYFISKTKIILYPRGKFFFDSLKKFVSEILQMELSGFTSKSHIYVNVMNFLHLNLYRKCCSSDHCITNRLSRTCLH